MKPTNRDLDAALCRLFGWKETTTPDGEPCFEDPKQRLILRHYWTTDEIAAELRKLGHGTIFWGWLNGKGYAQIGDGEEDAGEYCSDESIPELDRPRHALGWLALERAK